jgi:hypothetical protein
MNAYRKVMPNAGPAPFTGPAWAVKKLRFSLYKYF